MGKTKGMKKIVAVALLASVISVAGAGVVYAADHIAGCASSRYTVSCTGPMYSHMTGAHQVQVAESGTTISCAVTEVYGQHDVYCSNSACGVHLSTGTRTCAQYHDCYLCEDVTGLCQY